MLLFYQISAWVFLIHMFLYAGFYCKRSCRRRCCVSSLWSTLARVRISGKFISVKHLQLFLLWIYWAAVRIIWVYVIAGSPQSESELAVCRAEKGKDQMNPPGKNYSERMSIFHIYFSSFILFKRFLRGLCKIGQHLGSVYMEWGRDPGLVGLVSFVFTL